MDSVDTSLNGYAEEFDRALRKKTPFANFNKDMNHAAIIVCMSFRHAQNTIKLLSKELDESLYGSKWFLEELAHFMDKENTSLKILIESDIPGDHPVIQESKKEPRIEIKRIPEEDVQKYPFNFMLVDDKGFRFEQDRESTEATVVFNYNDDPRFEDLRKSCVDWFDSRWRSISEA